MTKSNTINNKLWRDDFPILKQTVRDQPLVYLDSAASSQKPQAVISAIERYYQTDHANVHRGIHTLSERATQAYENARDRVQQFLHAKQREEIIFVRGTTEAINLIATSLSHLHLKAGDEIILTRMEHHSNIVPWQMLAERMHLQLKILNFNPAGELLVDELDTLMTDKTRLITLTHVSNALGTINPIKNIVDIAHDAGVPVLVDGAQAVPHLPVDVQALGCDFYCFSGHKMYGPTGIGVLYAKQPWLDQLPPYHGGGEMIEQVSLETGSTFQAAPYKFEAGTPNIAGAIGLAAAIDYLTQIGFDQISQHEHTLLTYATEQLNTVAGLQLIGTAKQKSSVLSFTLKDIHPHDIATILNDQGIAVRAGHHCAMPVMTHYQIPATTRASLGLYTNQQDIDALIDGLQTVRSIFK